MFLAYMIFVIVLAISFTTGLIVLIVEHKLKKKKEKTEVNKNIHVDGEVI